MPQPDENGAPGATQVPPPGLFVLVGGWPGSGKTTLAGALGRELQLPHLAKDAIKEALMDALGPPATVQESRRLGRAAVLAMLRAARSCPGAVLDSTWFGYARDPASELPGTIVEVRCVCDLDTVRTRYRRRVRDERHLDDRRDEAELWGSPVPPLGLGPLIEVDTARPVEVPALARRIRSVAGTPVVRQGAP